MAPPQPGDPGSTATGQAQVRQLIDRYADRLKANGAIRSPTGSGRPYRGALLARRGHGHSGTAGPRATRSAYSRWWRR